MIGMVGTGRPARIHKGVVEKLLNVVNNLLFEVLWTISEYPDASHCLLDDRLVIAPNGLEEIVPEQANQTLGVRLANRAIFFPISPDFLARPTVRDSIADPNVARAKDLLTDDAHAARVIERDRLVATRTDTGSVTLPHARSPRLTCEFGTGPGRGLAQELTRPFLVSTTYPSADTANPTNHA